MGRGGGDAVGGGAGGPGVAVGAEAGIEPGETAGIQMDRAGIEDGTGEPGDLGGGLGTSLAGDQGIGETGQHGEITRHDRDF